MQMKEREPLGFTLCALANAIKRRIDESVSSCVPFDITRTQSWIIGYIANHSEQNVFQRDIEAALAVRRSTATGILQTMEKNGLLCREPVEQDARLKKLTLTPQAVQAHETITQAIAQSERDIFACLNTEEKDALLELSKKLLAGMGCCCEPGHHEKSEERTNERRILPE